MMPDLGKYAVTVAAAYAASIALILVLVVASIRQSLRVKRALAAVEKRAGNADE